MISAKVASVKILMIYIMANKKVLPLTDTEIKNAKSKDKEYTLSDGNGLQLNITEPLSVNNHSIAYYLYDFFISNYKKYIIHYCISSC